MVDSWWRSRSVGCVAWWRSGGVGGVVVVVA